MENSIVEMANSNQLGTTSTVTRRVSERVSPISEKPRKIEIESLDVGYLLSVGCKKFAISDFETLVTNLQYYLLNPAAAEIEFNISGNLYFKK